MFNIMTITKIGGALCGALLVFLLLNWVADTIYFTPAEHGESSEAAYLLETDEDEAPADEETASTTADSGTTASTDTAASTEPTATLAEGDAAKGEKLFKKCKACHKIGEGENATGPSLYQVVGRKVASIPDFSYSSGMSSLGGTWTPEHLDAFLTKPKDLVPGTKMSFAGLKKEQDRADLIAYLATLGH